jgi:hypothetical protein
MLGRDITLHFPHFFVEELTLPLKQHIGALSDHLPNLPERGKGTGLPDEFRRRHWAGETQPFVPSSGPFVYSKGTFWSALFLFSKLSTAGSASGEPVVVQSSL